MSIYFYKYIVHYVFILKYNIYMYKIYEPHFLKSSIIRK